MNLTLDRFLYGTLGALLGAIATMHVLKVFERINDMAIIVVSMMCFMVFFFLGSRCIKYVFHE